MLDLSPSHFLPLKPLNGADHSFGAINKDVRCDRFQHAGIYEKPAGTTKKENHSAPNLTALASDIADGLPHFPSLHELDEQYNEELGINLPSITTCKDESEEKIQRDRGNEVDTYPPQPLSTTASSQVQPQRTSAKNNIQ